jgi:hypothetical protein
MKRGKAEKGRGLTALIPSELINSSNQFPNPYGIVEPKVYGGSVFPPLEVLTRLDETRQDKTRQDKTRQDKTVPPRGTSAVSGSLTTACTAKRSLRHSISGAPNPIAFNDKDKDKDTG